MPISDYSNEGDNELVVAIKAKNWERVRTMLEEDEETTVQLIRGRDEYGNAPLHAALGFLAPDDVSLTILHKYPEAVMVRGTEDWLPLHVAAMWGASPKVVEALIRQYPAALDDRAAGPPKGRTPRHFGARREETRHLFERSTEEWETIIDDGRRS